MRHCIDVNKLYFVLGGPEHNNYEVLLLGPYGTLRPLINPGNLEPFDSLWYKNGSEIFRGEKTGPGRDFLLLRYPTELGRDGNVGFETKRTLTNRTPTSPTSSTSLVFSVCRIKFSGPESSILPVILQVEKMTTQSSRIYLVTKLNVKVKTPCLDLYGPWRGKVNKRFSYQVESWYYLSHTIPHTTNLCLWCSVFMFHQNKPFSRSVTKFCAGQREESE